MIVVTGAAGFIGSNLVTDLNASGHTDIILVDTLGTGAKWKNISKREFEDIVLPDEAIGYLNSYRKKISAVFHIGANSSTTSIDGDAIVHTNLRSSMDYWRLCTEAQIPFYFASSAATYGDGSQGFDDEIDGQLLRPLNLYGWSKNAFDLWAQRQNAQGYAPPKWAGFKFFNVYGPNEYHKEEMKSLVAKNYENVKAGRPVRLFRSKHPEFEDGKQLRDFVYVKDCCNVILWFYKGHGDNGIYNIGSGKARSFLDLIHAIGFASSVTPKIEFVDLPAELEEKYQYFTQANMVKVLRQGFDQPLTQLEDGVADYITNYLSQNDQYR